MKELSPQERKRLWLRMGIRAALILSGTWCALRLGPALVSLFAPFLLAVPVAWGLSPVVSWLHSQLGWTRKFLTLLLLLTLFGLLFALLWGLCVGVAGEVAELAGDWKTLLTSFQAALDSINRGMSRFQALLPPAARTMAVNLSGRLFQWLDSAIPRILSAIADFLAGAVRGLPSFSVAVMVFALTAWLLTSDWPSLRVRVVGQIPDGSRVFLSQVQRAFRAGFGGYVKAELILSAGVFFLLLAGFLIIRESYAILLAFLLAMLDFVPLVGAGTALIPWAMLELLSGSPRRGMEVMILWGVVSLFRHIAEPRVLGSQTGLSPVASLVSVYVGMRLAGVWGMLLAPVLCLVIWNVTQAGIWDNAWRDICLASGDLAALLSPENRI